MELLSSLFGLLELDKLSRHKRLGVVLLDPDGYVKHSSDCTNKQLDRWRISINGGFLRFRDPVEDRIFRTKLAALDETDTATMALRRQAGSMPLFISLSTLDSDRTRLILIRDPKWVNESDVQQLRDVFGMTIREAQLATHLSSGSTLRQFAESRYLAMNTVKTHLKQVFKKAGVQSQMQLVSVVLGVLR